MRRDLQVALLRVPVARPPELAFIELLHEELLVVLPAGHRLLGRRGKAGLELRELAEERFILVRRPGAAGIYQNLILACRAAGFEPQVVAEVAHMLTNINLVAAGAGDLRGAGVDAGDQSAPGRLLPVAGHARADGAADAGLPGRQSRRRCCTISSPSPAGCVVMQLSWEHCRCGRVPARRAEQGPRTMGDPPALPGRQ